jgi:Tol biopolymer transport system component
VGFGFGALSPDGTRVALVGRTPAGEKLFVRTLATGTVRELAGTDGAQLPFWSPDSAALGFFASGKLQRVDVAGGTPVVIANAPSGGRGGSWNAAGVIIYKRRQRWTAVPC